ncbi:MAG: ribonuclease H family protein [Bacteroidales bacterium]|jgi:ribonuclease HI|nr:ribonuclease H family protein [Bacteroidales bacterium]
MTKKEKYYVVWSGRNKGVFSSWEDCKKEVFGYENAKYKSFSTKQEAEKAFTQKAEIHIYSKVNKTNKIQSKAKNDNNSEIIWNSISTDAACSGNPGVMEYRGVSTKTKKQLFFYKHPCGTNNIGEFLALVHGLSYLKKHNLDIPLYTDSVNAIKWVKQKKCKTKLIKNKNNEDLFEYIAKAEKWLEENEYKTQILKWETNNWGEIPADFGRK